MATLKELVSDIKKIVEVNPNAWDMEIIGVNGGSGEFEEISSMWVKKIGRDVDDEYDEDDV